MRPHARNHSGNAIINHGLLQQEGLDEIKQSRPFLHLRHQGTRTRSLTEKAQMLHNTVEKTYYRQRGYVFSGCSRAYACARKTGLPRQSFSLFNFSPCHMEK
jgi:hypothetical protein